MNKNYNTIDNYYKQKYNHKVAKISLNANFTCPNKDGTKGLGGCTYCSKLGSGDTAGNVLDSLTTQYEKIKEIMDQKWKDLLYIPYLQANSNTYGSIDKLKEIYEELLLLDKEKTVAIAIATRPDCFSEEIYDLLSQINQKKKIIIELGLQTSNEKTAEKINRCSTNSEFIDAVLNLKKRNIEVVAHIINGLPNETEKDMLETINFINKLPIDGLKIHSLLILKDTTLYDEYKEKPFKLLTLEEYTEITCKQIANLRPDIILHRLSADAKLEDLIEPLWTRKKLVVMNEIDKYLRKHNIHQGDNYKSED